MIYLSFYLQNLRLSSVKKNVQKTPKNIGNEKLKSENGTNKIS
jgi:hypothetical protein